MLFYLQVSISLWSSISGPVTGLFLLGSLKIFSRCTSKVHVGVYMVLHTGVYMVYVGHRVVDCQMV